jgi:hypothetical protein
MSLIRGFLSGLGDVAKIAVGTYIGVRMANTSSARRPQEINYQGPRGDFSNREMFGGEEIKQLFAKRFSFVFHLLFEKELLYFNLGLVRKILLAQSEKVDISRFDFNRQINKIFSEVTNNRKLKLVGDRIFLSVFSVQAVEPCLYEIIEEAVSYLREKVKLKGKKRDAFLFRLREEVSTDVGNVCRGFEGIVQDRLGNLNIDREFKRSDFGKAFKIIGSRRW